MSHRHPTDPSLPSATLQPDFNNSALSMLNQYGPKRSTDHSELRKLVLDYLCHQCFVDTAAAFAREASSNSPHDGSEVKSSTIAPGVSTNGTSAHAPKKSFATNGSTEPQPPVPLKDNVIERTVRFDTDEDGDAEMGDLTHSSSNGRREDEEVQEQSGPSRNNGVKDLNDETMSDVGPGGLAGSVPETYPDWTTHDIQTTQLRLVIKENIITGKLKEAIGLIDLYFPSVLGPSPLSKLHTTPHPPASTATPTKPFKPYGSKPARAMFGGSRPLGGPIPKPPPINMRQPSYHSSSQTHSTHPAPQSSTWSSSLRDSDSASPAGRQAPVSNPTEEFPHAMFSSLEPAHVALNLQIQYFVELVRSSSSPSSSSAPEADHLPGPSNGTLESHGSSSGEKRAGVTKAHDLSNSTGGLSDDTSTTSSSTVSSRTHSIALSLPHARSLFCYAQTLPKPNERAIFVKELESVSGLLAYVDPWTSPIKRYLDQSRREMLAEIVNAAILVRIGRSPMPILKMVAQQTSFTWSTLSETGERIPCPRPDDKNRSKPCHFFNLTEFVNSHEQS